MRGQVSATDFAAGFLIFMIAVFAFFNYSQISTQGERDIDLVRLSEELLTSGYPADWNETNVLRIGLLSNDSIDTDKWMTLRGFDIDTKNTMLSTPYYYRISVHPSDLGIITNYNDTATLGYDTSDTVRRIERIVAYNGTIARLEVIAWH
ncbi:MAG: hypothetical protein ACMXYM_00335 [Candidatus Woesearchaeota archaeon]